MNFKEMCVSARMAHLKYTISKINQAILLIHECVYTIDARLIRFEFIAHLNNMMTRQSQQFENIQKAYSSDDIGEDYIFSSIKSLRDLL